MAFAPGLMAQDPLPIVDTESQPLAANIDRLLDTLEYLGSPLPAGKQMQLREAVHNSANAQTLQEYLDPLVLFGVTINPELRVKVSRGVGPAILQQAGFQPCLIKVHNEATVTRAIEIRSPQAGPVYSGAALAILKRQAQTTLANDSNIHGDHRFLALEMFNRPPMTRTLSGLEVEYVVALIYSSEAGKREANIIFDLGQGTQDLGFRSQVPVLFDIRPAVPVGVSVRDTDGQPTTARLEIRDAENRIYPPQAKRLAPDFFFQPQVYRSDGDTLLLPPGEFKVVSSRGPEYQEVAQTLRVQPGKANELSVQLRRWVHPQAYGFYGGDHHIHGAGCSHYDNPTLGVTPPDMFAQVKGEGLNVGCVLTWGPCFEHQRNYFSPLADATSEPLTLIKYDLEISGFGSQALGHVCLLHLKDQTYPGSEGSKLKGWPTWTVPVLAWAKEQGGVTGYPHSAIRVNPPAAADWIMENYDQDQDLQLSAAEVDGRLLPQDFGTIDQDRNGQLDSRELTEANELSADQLPNLALPGMDGGGAMEIFVSTPAGVCDFISAMDTARIPEWNTWYHLMNCGFPLKLSGETDFPCMSSRRVGQGRVYVQLGDVKQIDFSKWCQGIAAGNSYVSDGFAHALEFQVNGQGMDEPLVELASPDKVRVRTSVAFAAQQPRGVAYGTISPAGGRRWLGDTVNLHAPRDMGLTVGGTRLVECVVNGHVQASAEVAADGQLHELEFEVPIQKSSWIAIRQFPQLHTNPIEVAIAGKPIRASKKSAIWCLEATRILWRNRSRFIAEHEREAARQAYEAAIRRYAEIAAASEDDGTRLGTLGLPAPRS